MIKVRSHKDNDKISKVVISGHAGYAPYGHDIVCSAVSSIITTSINGILSFGNTIKATDDGKILLIEVLENDEITDKLMINMLNLLKEIEKDYQKNIKIEGE